MDENNYSEHSVGPLGVTRTIVTCKRCRIKKLSVIRSFPNVDDVPGLVPNVSVWIPPRGEIFQDPISCT